MGLKHTTHTSAGQLEKEKKVLFLAEVEVYISMEAGLRQYDAGIITVA